jgi:hypothetical protein
LPHADKIEIFYFCVKSYTAGCQWLTPIIRRQRSGGSRFKVSPGKQFLGPYLEKTQHKKGLVEWLKW